MQFHSRTENNLVKIDPVIDANQALIYIGTPEA